MFASIAMMLAGCTMDIIALAPGPLDVGDESSGEDSGEDSEDEFAEASGDDESSGDESELARLDLGGQEFHDACEIAPGELDAALPCDTPQVSATLSPQLAWSWTGADGEDSALVTPLVANLDDDNGDGLLDLCDTPDVVVVTVDLPKNKGQPMPEGHLVILDGASGQLRLRVPTGVDASVTPAIADLDGDGRPEIVTLEHDGPVSLLQLHDRRLIAFDAEGELLWTGSDWFPSRGGGAVTIADLDGDGRPEILAPEHVADSSGQLLWALDDPPQARSMPVAVDLDLDGDLEVLFGSSAYDHLGTPLFEPPGDAKNVGLAAVANFDDDPYPEIYLQTAKHRILEHDGSLKTQCPGGLSGPAAIADLDGDEIPELIAGVANKFGVLLIVDDQLTKGWQLDIDEVEGASSGTVFDLLADGSPELIHADRSRLRIYDIQGEVLFQTARSARSNLANPIVVDVDNDGAAEILVVSSEVSGGLTPTLMVFENADDAFAPTRRIWNQHAYYQANISESAGLPSVPAAATGELGFRTNGAPLGPPLEASCQGLLVE
ncbi:VCBS repeat-containing protein [Pseudenhygromyxa sp. WMMC2535]|uniref:FG-GAP repeat domain-containing protein n=1 Tax=Pseudenhygromyxa sp. WMMC2535 TaxID=2712867 RepID=UPI0015951657|nr:VCBS repeat-containing protein [Pseudenhygromyxa sp. WMMC2535]NVB38857.1 VCBS repeat-containing protein [Pseudenhygromyxa sp. WMMC2535]